jgi:hypothetical protein
MARGNVSNFRIFYQYIHQTGFKLIQCYAPFLYGIAYIFVIQPFKPINFRSKAAGGCIFNSCIVAGFGPQT